jgi:DNA-binding MarR family transcriptional regulator
MEKEDLHILRLMGEIDRDGGHSQRELSRRLNLSLGLVNTFLKRLVKKGYFKVMTMPKNRVRYFLTPAGLARKSKLTVEYLQYSVNFYKDIKDLLLNKYMEMKRDNVRSVLFYGAGEVAELAFLYLQLTDIELVGIIDDKQDGNYFFGFQIAGLDCIEQVDWDVILLTRLEDSDQDIKSLLERGIDPERIITI